MAGLKKQMLSPSLQNLFGAIYLSRYHTVHMLEV